MSVPIILGAPAVTLLNAANSQTAAVQQFSVSSDSTITLNVAKVGSFTVLTFVLQVNYQGIWQTISATWDANSLASFSQFLSAGSYQLLCTGFASGTSCTVTGSGGTIMNGTTAAPFNVVASTLTKGTQGANGLSVQDLKDAGRVIKVFSASFSATTSEALVTLTPITDGTAGSTGTSFAVTAGKRFRVQALLLSIKNAAAAIQGGIVNLRMSASGAVTTSSPLVTTVGASTLAATANLCNGNEAMIPDGLEFSGTMQFGVSQVGIAAAGYNVTLVGYEY
jgi:hypothetical protein